MSIQYVMTYLTVVFSGFYMGAITQYSPVYIFALIGLILYVYLLSSRSYRVDKYELYFILIFLYFFITEIVVRQNYVAVSFLLSYVFGFVSKAGLRDLPIKRKDAIINSFIVFTLFYYSLDLLYRIYVMSGDINALIQSIFSPFDDFNVVHEYKDTFIFPDSNGTAFVLIVLFWFIFYLYKNKGSVKYLYYMYICFAMIVFSVSRSAWVSMMITWVFYMLIEQRKKARQYYVIPVLVLAVVVLMQVYNSSGFQDDLSYKSKFDIIDTFIEYLKSDLAIDKLLFGNGLRSTLELFDVYGHIHFVKFIVDSGYLGMLLIVSVYIYVYRRSAGALKYILFIAAIAGMSYYPEALSYMYVIFSIVVDMEEKKMNFQC